MSENRPEREPLSGAELHLRMIRAASGFSDFIADDLGIERPSRPSRDSDATGTVTYERDESGSWSAIFAEGQL